MATVGNRWQPLAIVLATVLATVAILVVDALSVVARDRKIQCTHGLVGEDEERFLAALDPYRLSYHCCMGGWMITHQNGLQWELFRIVSLLKMTGMLSPNTCKIILLLMSLWELAFQYSHKLLHTPFGYNQF